MAPVLEPGATHRTTYLPHGLWWDYWTNDRVEGGKDEVRQVDLEVLPLYVKAGTILPLGPVKQYAQEASNEPLTLRIYPGADGAMALYEDDGISFGYLKGQFSRLLCTWNDKQRILTLKADARGKLPMRQAIVVEIAGAARNKPLTLRNGTASIHLDCAQSIAEPACLSQRSSSFGPAVSTIDPLPRHRTSHIMAGCARGWAAAGLRSPRSCEGFR